MAVKRVVWLGLLMGMLLFAGCATPAAPVNPQPNDIKNNNSIIVQPKPETPVGPSVDKMQLTIYFPTKDALHLQPEVKILEYNDHPARTAIELLIKGSQNKELVTIFPANTKLRSIKIKDNIAYVDFDAALLKTQYGGSSSERLLVAAVVNTLTEFENIEKVQFLVQGKIVETIWGHMDVSEPLSRNEKIIKK